MNKKNKGLRLGSVSFTGLGGYTEKMLSEVLENGIAVRNIVLSDGKLCGAVSPLDYYRVSDIARKNGNTMIWLTVNIHNNAVPIYEKMGMKRIRSEITEIGHGYVMDDHIYGFEL